MHDGGKQLTLFTVVALKLKPRLHNIFHLIDILLALGVELPTKIDHTSKRRNFVFNKLCKLARSKRTKNMFPSTRHCTFCNSTSKLSLTRYIHAVSYSLIKK